MFIKMQETPIKVNKMENGKTYDGRKLSDAGEKQVNVM